MSDPRPTAHPLRIALVHPFSWPEVRRGGERYLADLTWYLGAAGHRVDVITGTAGSTARDDSGGVSVRRLRHFRSGPLGRRGIGEADTFGLRAYPSLLRTRYDLVHAFTPTAAVAARLAGQRTLYTVLGHPTPALVAELRREARLMRAAVRAATMVAALSAASVSAVRASFGRAAEVLPPGVILDRFPHEATPRMGPPRILFTSFATNPHKGLDVLLAAFARLLVRFPDARLVLAGPGDTGWALDRLGPLRGSVEAALEVPGVGSLADVPRLYREATVTALPSINEAFGLVLVESLASGTPAVCNDDGGMPEIVDRPEVGRVVPPGDPAALADALEQTVVLAGLRDTPGACREHARRWGWVERVGPLHEELYRRVATTRRGVSHP
jgi:phosphatidylinositol alpha-mannosyltransferase